MPLSLEEPKNICDQTFVAVLVSRLPGLLTDVQSAHQTLATRTTSSKLEIYLIFAPFKKKKSTLKTLLNRMSSSSSVKALDWQIRRDKKSSVDNIRSLNTALLCLSCQAMQSSSDFSWSALEEGREKRTNAETGEEERGDRCRLTERKCETERWERAVINIHQGDKGPDCNSVAVQYFVLMFGVLGSLPVPYAIKCLCVENLQSGVSVHFQTNSVQVRFKWVRKQGDRRLCYTVGDWCYVKSF